MLKFTLPNFFNNFYINLFFIDLNKMHPEWFKTPISFTYVTGSYPYCSWNGGSNVNYGIGAYYHDFINCSSKTPIPIRLNMSNIYLDNYDFYDNMANTILNLSDNGSNTIEISNLDLMEYIKSKYKNYKFMFSKQAHLITPFTADLLNSIVDFNNFYQIGIPIDKTKDFDFLQNLKQKNLYEITVNSRCPLNCKHLINCLTAEHISQLEYSGQQNIEQCYKNGNSLHDEKRILTIEELKEKYIPLGFNNFTFSEFAYASSNAIYEFYKSYFIKPECFDQVNKLWLQSMDQRGV